MARQRAETNDPIDLGLPGQLRKVADIDQQLGRRQPHVEAGEQALAAGHRNGVAVRRLRESGRRARAMPVGRSGNFALS